VVTQPQRYFGHGLSDWWQDNVKMDLREIGWGGMDWIDLAQDMYQCRALVDTVMNLWVS
jgi:hypothetical protein